MLRVVLLTLLTLSLIAAEPDAAPAREAALSWLPLVDSAKYPESWTHAADSFKAAVTKEQWAAAAETARGPLGKFKSRTFALAQFLKDPPNAPAGDYFLLQFTSDFENRFGATETIILVQQGKSWRTAGYFIK